MAATDKGSLLKRSELESEYKVEVKHNIDRLGEVLVLKNQEGHRIMAKEKRPTTIEDCKRDVNQAIERMKLNHNHLLKMHDYSVILEDGQYVIRGYYELADANLAIELEQRKEAKASFTVEELRNLLVDILEIVTFLKEKKMIHGDIRPEYVMYDADTQIYKLADRLGDPSPPTKVQAKNIVRGRKLYLSPQIFFNLVHQTRGTPDFESVKLNPYLSEGYAIGLLMLESSLLEDVQSIYDFDYGHINEGVLAEKIDRFVNQFEDQDIGLVRAVQDLLETSEEERPDLHLLLTGLKSTPQNSIDDDDLGDLQYATDGDFQRDIIEEVEEEDDLSTQNHIIKSTNRNRKESAGDLTYKNDSYTRGGSNYAMKSPDAVQLTHVSAKEISDFPELSAQKESHKNENQHNESLDEVRSLDAGKPQVPQILPISQKVSVEDLLLPQKSLEKTSVHDHSASEIQGNHKQLQDSKGPGADIKSKDSKVDSKNETTKHSVSHDLPEDDINAEKDQSLEHNFKKEFLKKREEGYLNDELNTGSHQSSHYALHEKVSYQSAREEHLSPSRDKQEAEEVDWDKNLAEIKRQREEVMQGLQSLKLLQQDNHRSGDDKESKKDKTSSNIFKEEFASGQSLHYMVPNQFGNSKSNHNSGEQKNSLDRERDFNLQGKSKPPHNTPQNSRSEVSAGQQPLGPTHNANNTFEYDYKNARFDYNDEKYAYNNYDTQTENEHHYKLKPQERICHLSKADIISTRDHVSYSNEFFIKENMPSLPRDIGEVTPGKPQDKHSSRSDITNPASNKENTYPSTEIEKTPQNVSNKRKYEESTQFRAYEETPTANYAKAHESRVLIDEQNKTSPFTALRPGDVLINSNQKVDPPQQYDTRQLASENMTESTSVRELATGSMVTSNKDLSSFNVTSYFDASEKRSPGYFNFKASNSPIPKKYEPLVTTPIANNQSQSKPIGYLTPSTSQHNLFTYDEGDKHTRVTPSQPQFKFKSIQESTPVLQSRTYQGYTTIHRDISPTPAGLAISQANTQQYQTTGSYSKLIVTSHVKPEDLKPIVIRSRSTTPIKNTLAGLASVAESISQIANPFSSLGQMKASQGASTNYSHTIQATNYQTTQAAANLDEIFRTGSNAPAYRDFGPPKAQEYYETVSPRINQSSQNGMISSNTFNSGHQGNQLYQSPDQSQWMSKAENSSTMARSTFVSHTNHQVITMTPPRSVSPIPADSYRRTNLLPSAYNNTSHTAHQSVYVPQATFNSNSQFQTNTVHNSGYIPSTSSNYYTHGMQTPPPQRSVTPTRSTQQPQFNSYLARGPSSSSFVGNYHQGSHSRNQWQSSSQYTQHY